MHPSRAASTETNSTVTDYDSELEFLMDSHARRILQSGGYWTSSTGSYAQSVSSCGRYQPYTSCLPLPNQPAPPQNCGTYTRSCGRPVLIVKGARRTLALEHLYFLMVHAIHDWAWAGTPNEDAAWLRLRRLADTWYRILLIPITGGVMVGMMHGLLEILYQIRQSSSPQQGFDLVAGVFPLIKAIQAAATLGTGSSLGPEGPSVDIGKSCANGFSLMMENNRERRIALVATGAASGIASECLITVALHSIPWLVLLPAVAGCFFAIETVLRHLRAENSPPFTTAMIILASVISSTGSSALLGTESAFPMPSYDLKSATGDIRQYLSEKQSMSPTVIQRILIYLENYLAIAKVLMEAKGIKQLPVVKHDEEPRQGRKGRIAGVLHYGSIWNCLREEIKHSKSLTKIDHFV
ncbi:hypothetical protein V6N13_147653 [Hibiscus sabdariffa]